MISFGLLALKGALKENNSGNHENTILVGVKLILLVATCTGNHLCEAFSTILGLSPLEYYVSFLMGLRCLDHH